jgi:hypothetical protein
LRKFLIWALGILLTGILFIGFSYFFAYPQVFRCATIRFARFTEIQAGIYISDSTSATQQEKLISLIKSSRQRLNNFWDTTESKPVIIFCHSPELYEQYGSPNGSPANFFASPLGAYVVISPEGLDVDVISHEMCHAELTGRVGWLTMNTQVPQWFNEGLALMVDYRFPNNNGQVSYRHYRQKWKELTYGNKFMLHLEQLENIESFSSTDAYSQQLAYLRSGMEVSRWLEKVRRKGLLHLINQIEAGRDFDESYKETEQSQGKGFNESEVYSTDE